ncbi:hypothetical protein, partial [Moorena sp. SIO3I6]|uniref:hypothetical protein n=1 Tax=Moorena sp. SIO3I6 TaxID=2607831 RepID=UPI0025DBB449
VFLESPVSSTALGSGTNAMSLSYHIIEGFGSRWNIFTNCSLTSIGVSQVNTLIRNGLRPVI